MPEDLLQTALADDGADPSGTRPTDVPEKFWDEEAGAVEVVCRRLAPGQVADGVLVPARGEVARDGGTVLGRAGDHERTRILVGGLDLPEDAVDRARVQRQLRHYLRPASFPRT